jgi:SAM-dependent methyltransferase
VSRPLTGERAPQRRFSDRVADYVRYRPSYPAAAIDWLVQFAGLKPGDPVADVGSGTGICARLLLERGLTVFAVEPNDDMRLAAEGDLAGRPGFHSIAGASEATQLADGGVRAIVAAQAFHWFDPQPTRREWVRILSPGGAVVLMWNHRAIDATPFMRGYDALLQRYCPEYPKAGAEHVRVDVIESFLAPAPIEQVEFPNHQELDWDGLRGRLRSSSYVPRSGPDSEALFAHMERLFGACQQGGRVRFEYRTRLWASSPS